MLFLLHWKLEAELAQAPGWAYLALLPSNDLQETGLWRLVGAASPALDAGGAGRATQCGQECPQVQVCDLILLLLLTATSLPLIHLF